MADSCNTDRFGAIPKVIQYQYPDADSIDIRNGDDIVVTESDDGDTHVWTVNYDKYTKPTSNTEYTLGSSVDQLEYGKTFDKGQIDVQVTASKGRDDMVSISSSEFGISETNVGASYDSGILNPFSGTLGAEETGFGGTVDIDDGIQTTSFTKNIKRPKRYYYDSHSSSNITSTQLDNGNSALYNSIPNSIDIDTGNGGYWWFALPADEPALSIKVGGFNVTVDTKTISGYSPVSGYSTDYLIYFNRYETTGVITVEIST